MLKAEINRGKYDSLNCKPQMVLPLFLLRFQGKRLIAEDEVSAEHVENPQSVLIISTDQSHHREPKTANRYCLHKPLPESGWLPLTQHGLPTVTYSGMVEINGSVARDNV